MAPRVVSEHYVTGTITGGSSYVGQLPTDVQAGDELLVDLCYSNSEGIAPGTPTTPSGWVQVRSYSPADSGWRNVVYRRRASGGDTNPSFATSGTRTDQVQWYAVCLRGARYDTNAAGTATTGAWPAAAAPYADSFQFMMGSLNKPGTVITTIPPSTSPAWTLQEDQALATTGPSVMAATRQLVGSAGVSVASGTATYSATPAHAHLVSVYYGPAYDPANEVRAHRVAAEALLTVDKPEVRAYRVGAESLFAVDRPEVRAHRIALEAIFTRDLTPNQAADSVLLDATVLQPAVTTGVPSVPVALDLQLLTPATTLLPVRSTPITADLQVVAPVTTSEAFKATPVNVALLVLEPTLPSVPDVIVEAVRFRYAIVSPRTRVASAGVQVQPIRFGYNLKTGKYDGFSQRDAEMVTFSGPRTRRWTLRDPDTGDRYEFVINPDEMTSPYRPREARSIAGNFRGDPSRLRTIMGARQPVAWSFGGAGRSKQQYDDLLDWCQRDGIVRVTDHLGRVFECVLTQFDPVERRPTKNTSWRFRYTVHAYILRRLQ